MAAAETVDTLFTRRRRALYALALQRLGNAQDAEDAVQDTYVKCLNVAWDRVQSPDAMLTTIHLNGIRDSLRRRARNPVGVAEADEMDQVRCLAPTPEQALLSNRRWQRVAAAIAALPPVCRRVFLMCKLGENSHAEISAATGLSRAAVEKNIVRAMQRLRRDLAE